MRSVSRPAGSASGALLAVGGALPDLCCVIAFIMIGRASHTEGETLAGLARTAWPFLSGLTVGWLVTRAWQRPAALFPVGVGGWKANLLQFQSGWDEPNLAQRDCFGLGNAFDDGPR